MNWIDSFTLFLFDFDGLLVDTESLHYAAYQKLIEEQGFVLPWNLLEYLALAHAPSSTKLREKLYETFPTLNSDWSALYKRKKEIYIELLKEAPIVLMPGVEALLEALAHKGKKMCVVTNSTKEQIDLIKKRVPILQKIPLWITRERYQEAKPSSQCYKIAMDELYEDGDHAIGFEDSLRGHAALEGIDALPILVCFPEHPQMQSVDQTKIHYFPSFEEINKRGIHHAQTS